MIKRKNFTGGSLFVSRKEHFKNTPSVCISQIIIALIQLGNLLKCYFLENLLESTSDLVQNVKTKTPISAVKQLAAEPPEMYFTNDAKCWRKQDLKVRIEIYYRIGDLMDITAEDLTNKNLYDYCHAEDLQKIRKSHCDCKYLWSFHSYVAYICWSRNGRCHTWWLVESPQWFLMPFCRKLDEWYFCQSVSAVWVVNTHRGGDTRTLNAIIKFI